MRIVLVAIHPYPSPQAVPLANAFLKGAVTGTAVEIELVDFFIGHDTSDCIAKLVELHPAAVGFSMYTWNRSAIREITVALRRSMPGAFLFAGGPETTAAPQGVLAESPFDFLLLGEGEASFAAICKHLATGESVKGIPGVAVRGTDAIDYTPCTPLDELDTIRSPWLNNILDAGSYRGILWQLSRGCSFACDFCYDSRDSHGVRRFSLERIEAELRHFVRHNVAQIFVLDSTFNQDTQRAKTVLRLIRRIAPHIHFHFEVRSEFIDREMALLFAEIACSLQIGLQSSDRQVLKDVGRAFSAEDFAARIALLNETGAVFGFDLMYGLPGDTLSGFCKSLDFALGLYPNHLDIFPLAILPGTALAARSEAIGLRHLPAPPYTLVASPTFSEEDIKMSQALSTACDIFYTRGKAVAWFNSVVASLRLKPSLFLQQFATWLFTEKGAAVTEADLGDHEIWQMQRAFLINMYKPKKLKRLLPLVLDLVDYHYHYAAAILSPVPVLPEDHALEQTRLLDTPCQLAASTRLAQFNYEILDILEAGEPDIRGFSDNHTPTGSYAAIYPAADGIRTESLIEPYYRLIERLDGYAAPKEIARKLQIPPDEALEFLEFAVADGIVILSGGCKIKND